MKRFFNPFTLIITSVFSLLYWYCYHQLGQGITSAILLAFPFILVWLIPYLYWSGEGRRNLWIDKLIHYAGHVSMGILSFLVISLVITDFVCLLYPPLLAYRTLLTYSLTAFSTFLGLYQAKYGPEIKMVTIYFENLHPDLDGFRIAHLTDLHVGQTIRGDYVHRVVNKTKSLTPDLIALTGDFVDGSPEEHLESMRPLEALQKIAPTYMCLGNHDYYSGAARWTKIFNELGLNVLVNEHTKIDFKNAKLLIAGITDPAARAFGDKNIPDAAKAMGKEKNSDTFKLLLAHNPKLASMGEKAGFDLQLSGHTHAGQFFPWTLIVRFIHRPHYWGLSKEGNMKVYVGAGTGSWGPPIRLGTKTELTLIVLRSLK